MPEQKTLEERAAPCQVILLRESEIEETVADVAPSFVTIESMTISFVFVVLNGEMVNDEPEAQVPEALPSRFGAGALANTCSESEPAGIDVADANCGDHRYIVAPAARVNDPAAWTIASHAIPQ